MGKLRLREVEHVLLRSHSERGRQVALPIQPWMGVLLSLHHSLYPTGTITTVGLDTNTMARWL
jgi:hypothetical protein